MSLVSPDQAFETKSRQLGFKGDEDEFIEFIDFAILESRTPQPGIVRILWNLQKGTTRVSMRDMNAKSILMHEPTPEQVVVVSGNSLTCRNFSSTQIKLTFESAKIAEYFKAKFDAAVRRNAELPENKNQRHSQLLSQDLEQNVVDGSGLSDQAIPDQKSRLPAPTSSPPAFNSRSSKKDGRTESFRSFSKHSSRRESPPSIPDQFTRASLRGLDQFMIRDFRTMKKLRLLKTGSFGIVTLVEDSSTYERFALKSLRQCRYGPDISETLSKEINSLIRIQHPCIVPIVGYSPPAAQAAAQIAMKFAANGSLREALDKVKSGSPPLFMDDTGIGIIIVGIVIGMKFIHSQDLVHRDLKPENILLDENGYPQIADLGMSRLADLRLIRIKKTGSRVYMAPEMSDGRECTSAVDVYSFSWILYELLCEPSMSPDDLQKQLPNEIRPQFPKTMRETMKRLIAQCWSKDPFQRMSFNEIFDTLGRIHFKVTSQTDSLRIRDFISSISDLPQQQQETQRVQRTYSPSNTPFRRSSLNLSHGSGPPGLDNLGDTCYLNSVLQCLVRIKPFTDFILSPQFRENLNPTSRFGSKTVVAQEFQKLLQQLQISQRSVRPSSFKSALGQHNVIFSDRNQHDAQECLLAILDVLDEDLNQSPFARGRNVDRSALSSIALHRATHQSIVTELFCGEIRNTFNYLKCHSLSTLDEPLVLWQLPLDPNAQELTLDECIKAWRAKEELGDDYQFSCLKCGEMENISKQQSIRHFGKILMIQLRRFKEIQRGTQKNDVPVDYPFNLDSSKYASVGTGKYHLIGVICHEGGVSGGHYYCIVKDPNGETWYTISDSMVQECEKSEARTREAYILFYQSDLLSES